MSFEIWQEVDDYAARLFFAADPALDAALMASEAAGLDPIAVSQVQGQLLGMFVRIVGAKRILEIGTLGGYSAICMGRALPEGGRLVTLELDPRHAEVAEGNIAVAGLADRIEIRVASALDSLAAMVETGEAPFDFVFIDANKDGYPEYFEWVLKLSHPGTVIVADNVVRNGAVLDADSPDPYIQGIRRFNERVAAEPRVSAVTLQNVGSKGYDGFAILRVETT